MLKPGKKNSVKEGTFGFEEKKTKGTFFSIFSDPIFRKKWTSSLVSIIEWSGLISVIIILIIIFALWERLCWWWKFFPATVGLVRTATPARWAFVFCFLFFDDLRRPFIVDRTPQSPPTCRPLIATINLVLFESFRIRRDDPRYHFRSSSFFFFGYS